MSSVFPLIQKLFLSTRNVHLGDVTDKSHYVISCGLFAIFSMFIGSFLTIGDPISCLIPTEFPGTWVKYSHSMCFFTSTYSKRNLTLDFYTGGPGNRIHLDYYQWIPYILALQALLFYLPHWLWRYFEKQFDPDFEFVVSSCIQARSAAIEEREKIIKNVTDYLGMHFTQTRGVGCFSTAFYLLSKFLNLINACAQLIIINTLVGHGRVDWGFELLHESWSGIPWNQTSYFPRFAFCDFEMYNYLGQPNSREVQCALVVNVYNEKVFIIAYFWIIILALLTFVNTLYSCLLYLVSFSRIHFAGRLVKGPSPTNKRISRVYVQYQDFGPIANFATNFVGIDGLLLFRFVESNAGRIIASDIVSRLYNNNNHMDGAVTAADPNGEIGQSSLPNRNNLPRTLVPQQHLVYK